MTLPVFLAADGTLADAAPGRAIELTGPEARHAVTVRRIGPGERVELVDGRGTRATVTVTATAGKDRLSGHVDEVDHEPAAHPAVSVVQAIPKSPHAELAVDLATQAGADAIIAWQAERCVARWNGPKRHKGLNKWADKAREAGKQARRARLPEVTGPVDTAQLAAVLRERTAAGALALVLHETAADGIAAALAEAGESEEILLVVGPEGGIPQGELDRLAAAGARTVRLGPQVARASSAAALGLAAVGVLTGRW